MTREDKHLLWTSDIDLDNYKEWLDEEFPDASETRRWELAEESNADMLECERENLDIQLDDDIIVIADLGRWSGRVPGYKIIPSGNIKDCLSGWATTLPRFTVGRYRRKSWNGKQNL